MQTLDLTCGLVRGAMTCERSAHGLRLSRLPATATGRDPDPQLILTAEMAAGMRLRIDSDTLWLELDVEATGLCYAGGTRRQVVFDLFAGERFERRVLSEGPTLLVDFEQSPPMVTLKPGPDARLRFGPLPPGMKRLELWLPQNAAITLKALRVEVDAQTVVPCFTQPRWLHYGSSISHGKEAEGPSECWPGVVARRLELDLTSLGYSGNCLLEGFVARAMAERDADILSMEIGINVVTTDAMRERAFIPAVHEFLDILRSARPDVPLLLISPIHAGAFETRPGPARRGAEGIVDVPRPASLAEGALTAAAVRQLLEDIVARRSAQGDRQLHYCDGRLLFGAEDAALLVDGLHPSAAGQRLIGQRAIPFIERLLPVD